MNSGLVPLYLTEITPVNLRGAAGSVHQLVVTLSIVISIMLAIGLGTAEMWPILFGMHDIIRA